MWATFLASCKNCLLFNGSVFYLLYALLVFVASMQSFNIENRLRNGSGNGNKKIDPPMVGELGTLTRPGVSIHTQVLIFALGIASFSFFRLLVNNVVGFIRTTFFMGDKPSFLTSFKRYFFFYLVIIPLPAAFMPPVAYVQRKPDFQLLAAVVLLICINALGDAASIRLTLRNFERLKFREVAVDGTKTEDFWISIRNESLYYVAVARGTFYSLGILILVLAFSSVLYGVQTGQLEFEFSKNFALKAWDRILRFPDLAFELYWFREQAGPFGLDGIPGLFLYALTTFVPIIVLLSLALLWLSLIPFRIAVNLPTTRWARAASSEFAVLAVCVAGSYALEINILSAYTFLMHIWTTW